MHVFCIPVSEGQQLTRVSCLGQAINFKVAGYDPSPLYKQSTTLTQSRHMYVINETTSPLHHPHHCTVVRPTGPEAGLYSVIFGWVNAVYFTLFPLSRVSFVCTKFVSTLPRAFLTRTPFLYHFSSEIHSILVSSHPLHSKFFPLYYFCFCSNVVSWIRNSLVLQFDYVLFSKTFQFISLSKAKFN